MLHHGAESIRCDNSPTHILGDTSGQVVFLGLKHRAGVKGGDLVVVQIGSDEGLCGVVVRENPQQGGV